MPKYRFHVTVSLSALEEELNRVVSDEPYLKLNQVFYAQGLGFVAVVERAKNDDDDQGAEREQEEEPEISRRRAKRKS
jgi:hypothetical protein